MEQHIEESFRDTLYTVDKEGNRHWVYPNVVVGRFFKARAVVAYLLMAIYLVAPWITINGSQAILLDIYNRRFSILGTQFWVTDSIFLMFILAGLGITLFFFTALLGRVWCGWACPETVFLEFLFRPIERLVEGNAAQRKRLDEQPWNPSKVLKKLIKHGLSAAAAWVLSTTALAYFFGAHRMLEMIFEGPLNHLFPFTLTIIFMGLFAFQFGWFREQFCTVLCPYARFQSVMLDSNSIVIGYDVTRGEPRGKPKTEEKHGHCVDCGLCVRVCPTGIDIRNGLQLECINCAVCIDACDSVMDKVGYPRGLVRYDSENRLLGKPSRILRPRVFVYAAILIVYGILIAWALANRSLTDFQLIRTPQGALYTDLPDGRVANQILLHVSNKSTIDDTYSLLIPPEFKDVEVIMPGSPYTVKAGEMISLPVFFNLPPGSLFEGKRPITVVLESKNGYRGSQKLSLLGPIGVSR